MGNAELQSPYWQDDACCNRVWELLRGPDLVPGTTLEQLQQDMAAMMSGGWLRLAEEEASITKLHPDFKDHSRRLLVMPATLPGHASSALTAAKGVKRSQPQAISSSVKSARSAAPTAPSSARETNMSMQQSCNQGDVQAGFNLVMRRLKQHRPDLHWKAWNTSSSGISSIRLKTDITFTQGSLVAWTQVVFLAVLKPKLDGAEPRGRCPCCGQCIM